MMRPFIFYTLLYLVSCGNADSKQVQILPEIFFSLDSNQRVCQIGKIGKYNYTQYNNAVQNIPFAIPANINVISDSNSIIYFGIPIGFDSVKIEKIGFKKQINGSSTIWINDYAVLDSSNHKISQAFCKNSNQTIFVMNFHQQITKTGNFLRILDKLSFKK